MSSSKQSPMRPLPTLVALALLVLTACGSGGGGGGSSNGGGADQGSGGIGDGEVVREVTVQARLAWAPASGPVAGYRVYVARNGRGSQIEATVEQPEVVIEGEPGDEVRIRVAAISSDGTQGPPSPPSPTLVFTEAGVTVAAAMVAESTATGSTGSSTARSAAEEPAAAETAVVVLPGDKTRGDFDGDGAADLLWEAPEPGVELRIATLWNEPIVRFDRPEGSWWVAGTDDFDGDGLTDLLWQSAQGVVAYTPLASLLETAPEARLVLIGTLDPDESIVSIGDFRGDGTADLLTSASGAGGYGLWLRDAVGATERQALDTLAPAGSRVVATGDYDGDGRSDVLWRTGDGALEVGWMNGAFEEERAVAVDTVSTPLVAEGDFDADGAADLMVRNATGGLEVLLQRDRAAAVPWGRVVDPGAGWEPSAPLDYDGDGSADLVWTSDADRVVRTHPVDGSAPLDLPIDADGAWVLLGELP